MDELVRWLGEQLDEDERIARAATPGPWELTQDKAEDSFGMAFSAEDSAHIVAHDPARVLREIDAKRRILALHRPYVPEPDQACLGCAGGIMFTSCPVVRLLALPYADRPGYRAEWRP